MKNKFIVGLLIASVLVWSFVFFLLNREFSSLIKLADSPSLKVDGYLGENIVRDSNTGSYWWIFSDRTDGTIKLARSSDLINWEIDRTFLIREKTDSACIRRFGGIWYIYYGKQFGKDRANLWMIKSNIINSNYSDPVLALNIDEGEDSWDYWRVSEPDIIWNDGLYYLFYMGECKNKLEKIGYAVSNSPSGPFTKYVNNPVLMGSSSFQGFYWNAGKDKAADPHVEKIGDVFVVQHTASSVAKRGWSIGMAITKNFKDFYCPDYPVLSGNGDNKWFSEGVSRGGLLSIGNKWYISYTGYNLNSNYGGQSGISNIDIDNIVNRIKIQEEQK